MVSRIFILVFAAVFWEAHSQPCPQIYPGLQRPTQIPGCPIEPQILPSIPNEAECLSARSFPFAFRPSANILTSSKPGASIETAASQARSSIEPNYQNSVAISQSRATVESNSQTPCRTLPEPTLSSPRLVPRFESTPKCASSPTDVTSTVLKLPISPNLRPMMRPGLLPTVSESCSTNSGTNFPKPLVNSYPPMSTIVYDSVVANSLADSLQMMILNDLFESSLDYAPTFSESVASAGSLSQPSVSIAQAHAISAINPSNLVETPFNVEPCRTPFINSRGGLNNLANLTPRISEVISPINVDTCREGPVNVFGGLNRVATPALSEMLAPVNIEPFRLPYPNVIRGLNNLVAPTPPSIDYSKLCGVPDIRPLTIAEIAQPTFPVSSLSAIPSLNPITASLHEISCILNTIGPMLEISDSLSSITSAYGVPVPSPVSSTVAIAEASSSVVDESPISRSSPLLAPAEISSTVSSASAVAESVAAPAVSAAEAISTASTASSLPVSNLALAQPIAETVTASAASATSVATDSSIASSSAASTATAASMTESALSTTSAIATDSSAAAAATTSVATETSVAASTATAVSGTAVVEANPVVSTISTAEVISSSPSATSLSPTFSYSPTCNPGIAPIILEIEIPSSFSPSSSSCGCNSAIKTTSYMKPLMYELEIPTSIPTQLTCSLGCVPSTTPVLAMSVAPITFGC